ncbi:MAG: hypothetical protein LBE22_05890 [Azoarcus sp.]|jgi:hypothetical protein|nr:hypothetical protein [Azoarcus sp.]
MPTPQEKLDAMLNDFQTANRTHTTDPGRQLRELIETTPGLKAAFLDQIDKGHLRQIVKLDTPNALGTYNAYTQTMEIPVGLLNKAANGGQQGEQAANLLRHILGHEINHAVTRDARLAEDQALRERVARIANGPPPHDYTATLKAYNESARSREVSAEIAGFNTLAEYVRNENPNATLKDLYLASRDSMKMYVDMGGSKAMPTYTLKPGLTLDNNLKMPSTQANRDAMGKYFYKANGYPKNKVGVALKYIVTLERNVLNAARAANPHHPAPKINVNLKEIDLQAVPLPGGFDDTNPRLRAFAQAPNPQRRDNALAHPVPPFPGAPSGREVRLALLDRAANVYDEAKQKLQQSLEAGSSLQSHKKEMDRALDGWVRQYGYAQEELQNLEARGNAQQIEAFCGRVGENCERMQQITSGVPLFEGEKEPHAERLNKGIERFERVAEAVADNALSLG